MIKISILVAALAISFSSQAIVKINTSVNKPEGFSGNISAEIEIEKTDSENSKREVEWSSQINYRNKNQIFTVLASEEYESNKGQVSEDSKFYHLRYTQVDALPHFHVEGFVQWQEDPFQQLSRRSLIGLGVSQYSNPYNLDFGMFSMNYFVGAMVESERSTLQNNIDDDSTRLASKFNAQLDLTRYQSEWFFTLYYQPKLDNWSDYRSVLQTGFTTTLFQNTTLSLYYQSKYDSKPFADSYKRRRGLTTSISYHF
jgi:hypothetical protein